jgi:hypothetical protein
MLDFRSAAKKNSLRARLSYNKCSKEGAMFSIGMDAKNMFRSSQIKGGLIYDSAELIYVAVPPVGQRAAKAGWADSSNRGFC